MAPKYTITYFDNRGRAECCRLILVAAGQKFEDVRLTQEQWAVEKSKTPFQQLPVLDIDGKRYGQTIALATYLAREFGFYGKNNLDSLKIDETVHLTHDFLIGFAKIWFEPDETKKPEMLKHFKEVEVPKYLGFFEKLLKESGTGYFVGNSLTLADIYNYDLMYALVAQNAFTTDGYPNIQSHNKRVESTEKIKAYLATRKHTSH